MPASSPTPAAQRLAQLNSGARESANLAEILRVDFAALLRAAVPQMGQAEIAAMHAQQGLGILKRMAFAGQLIRQAAGDAAFCALQNHRSDTVRGWACFLLGAQAVQSGMPLDACLRRIRPFADDAHFGVREWAWLAVREHLATQLDEAIAQLAAWTADASPRIRRFASEALRPRGVWCRHIAALKHAPEQALPILQPLRGDSAVYVQDSVANWLNDAGKTRPDWVRQLCHQWCSEAPGNPHTRRIAKRAMRSISE